MKNRQLIVAIISLASFALLGLMAIQIFWIKQDLKLRTQQFEQNAILALNSTAVELEKSQAKRLLEQLPYNNVTKQFSQTFNHLNFSLDTSMYHIDKETGNITLNLDLYHSGNILSELITQSIKQVDSQKVIQSWQYNPFNLFNEDFKKFTQQMQDFAVKSFLENQALDQYVDPLLVKNILEKELNKQGVLTSYKFAILDNPSLDVKYSNMTIDKKTILSSSLNVPLSTSEFLPPDLLVVKFPNQRKHIFQSMGWLFASSALFIILILLCFLYSLFIIVRQKKLSDMKTDFINNMTHELKTPVATISLASEMLANPRVLDTPDKIRNYSSIIKDENSRLSSHIEKVLQVALLEKSNFQLNKSMVDVHLIIKDIVHNVSIRVESEKGSIISLLEAKNTLVNVDKVHFINVLNNLIDNAIKYKKDIPRIVLSTKNTKNGIYIQIEDKGIGMSRETQKRAFEKFYRPNTGNIHNVKGFGLGLSYVQRIIHLHDGLIEIQSELGVGSTFKIFIPY